MAHSTQDPRMAFRCTQYDSFAHMERGFIITYFYEDSSFEMMEDKSGRILMRRAPTDIPRSAFYIGSTIDVLGRPTKITAYADIVTTQLCAEAAEMTVVIIGEGAFTSLGRCLSILLEECQFALADVQMAWVMPEEASERGLPFAADMQTGARVVVVKCLHADAIAKGLAFTQRVKDVYAASSGEEATEWVGLLAEAASSPLCVFDEMNSSVVVLKPALVNSGCGGSIIQQLIDLGLEPTGLTQFHFTAKEAHTFMHPYVGVLPDLDKTAANMVGNVWVLQLVSLDDSADVVAAVRAACGPFDPVIAKRLFPKTIRACFGTDCTTNAVHCCDLEGEGPIYTNFFFKKS